MISEPLPSKQGLKPKSGHHAMLEHVWMTVRFITDRGISHELVRHRIASFAQESTRYCNYSKNKFGNEITVIRPAFWEEDSKCYREWNIAMILAENHYIRLLKHGARPEQARSVLPNSLKTEIVISANMREFRHILKLRCSKTAHPLMRALMLPLLVELVNKIPVLFEDIYQEILKQKSK